MKTSLMILCLVLFTVPAIAQDVTPDVIFGSGNDNGEFTIFTDSTPNGDTLELGLRAKVRFNENGLPENTFNQELPGEYYHLAGIGSGDSPTWAFEWTVNTDATGLGFFKVGYFTYELGLDYDPGSGTNFVVFDPINVDYADHAFGDNLTPNGGGQTAATEAEYLTFLSQYNVVQQSWRYNWFDFYETFDPSEPGIYDIYLKAIYDGVVYGHTQIQVHVGYGEPVATESHTWGQVKGLYR